MCGYELTYAYMSQRLFSPLSLVCALMFLGSMICWSPQGIAQTSATSSWWQVSPQLRSADLPGDRYLHPQAYTSLQVDLSALSKAVEEPTLTLPWPDGSQRQFFLEEAPVMAPALAARFSAIKTLRGYAVDDPHTTLRLDVSPKVMHAMVYSPEGIFFMDPLTHTPNQVQPYYQLYRKRDVAPEQDWSCGVSEGVWSSSERRGTAEVTFSGELRSYRLAVSTTGEYSQFHGGTVSSVLNAIVAVINRVNGVYEREVGVTMELIANNDQILYFNSSTDPFSNFSSFALLGENQGVIDNVIGSANYDIGHVFSTGGGGVASLGSVCSSNSKARGVTGLPAPIGDPFAIDYVAHEIGHQFGATHTFNGATGSCAGGNRTPFTAYEPGSGSTIMAYAGICGSHNIQNFSNDYFHAASIEQIFTFTRNQGGASCAALTTGSNQPPVAAATYDNVVLPVSTPFRLEGFATDPDGDALTYCWEQWDLGPAGAPSSPVDDAPIIRSRLPLDSGVRYVPSLTRLASNTFSLGEILPTYSRNLSFRLTVRDNVVAGAGVEMIDVSYTVTDQAGPFLVTSPNASVFWTAGAFETVTWAVANTDQLPVDCQYVDIRLSTDGGETYPIVLADSVPNDGEHIIQVPNQIGNQNRIMVIAADHFFLDISNSNFTIEEAASPGFDMLALSASASICTGGSTEYVFLTSGLGGFSGNLTLATSGPVPPTLTLGTDPDPAAVGDTLRVQFQADTTSVGPAVFNFSIQASDGTNVLTFPVSLAYAPQSPSPPEPLSPVNALAGSSRRPTFSWLTVPQADSYQLALSTSPDLSNPMVLTGLTDTTLTLPTFLEADETYYWQLWAENVCGLGEPTELQVLRTGSCEIASNQDGPVAIPSFGSPAEGISTINLPVSGSISDVNVWDLQGTHPAMNELEILLRQAGQVSTEVSLYQPICGANDPGFRLSFDDVAVRSVSCPPFADDALQPAGALASFANTVQGPNWELVARDNVFDVGGSLDSWTLEVCRAVQPAPTVLVNLPFGIANGAQRTISNAYLSSQAISTPAAELVYTLSRLTENGDLLLNGQVLSLGDTFTQDQIDQGLLSYQHDSSQTPSDDFGFELDGNNNSWLGAQTFIIDVWALSVEESTPQRWSVMPNPARDQVQIRLEAASAAPRSFRLYNHQGKLLLEQQIEARAGEAQWTLSLKDLPTGVYLLSLESDGQRSTERIMVLR